MNSAPETSGSFAMKFTSDGATIRSTMPAVSATEVIQRSPSTSTATSDQETMSSKLSLPQLNQLSEINSPKLSNLQSLINVLPASKYSAMRALLLTLQTLFGEQAELYAERMDQSFYDIGGNADNSLVAVICLQHYKYKIDVLDFLRARNLKEVVMKMHPVGERCSSGRWTDLEKCFKHKRMRRHDLDFLFECLKGENLARDKLPGDWLDMWKTVISKGNHFIFKKRPQKTPVGIVLNFDINDDVHNKLAAVITGKSLTLADIQRCSFEMSSKSILIELLQFISENSHKKGKLLQPLFFTRKGLQDPDTVAIMILMEVYNFSYARKHKFKWIITSYPKLLQAQVERQILGFEVLLEDQADGRDLFNQYRCIFATKKI